MKKVIIDTGCNMLMAIPSGEWKAIKKMLGDYFMELLDNGKIEEYDWTMSKKLDDKLECLYAKYPRKDSFNKKEDWIKIFSEWIRFDKPIERIDISLESNYFPTEKMAKEFVNNKKNRKRKEVNIK